MVSPAVRKKLVTAILILAVFAVAAVLVQVVAENLNAARTGGSEQVELEAKEIFSVDDFIYGPQSWRPYQSRLDIGKSGDQNKTWLLMFIPLNGTPYGGNPAMHEKGSVLVKYAFENLAGEAAFHVYGFRQSDGLWVTNRQEDFGNSAFYVQGDVSPVPITSMGKQNPVPGNYTIRLSSAPGPALPSSFTLYFTQRPGSGLDALHITTNLTRRKGEVITTPLQEGTFFVTHTGGNPLRALLLMVAVSPGQPDDFRLRLTSEFVKETA